DGGHNADAQQHSKPVRREQCRADTAPQEKCKHSDNCQRAKESEFFTNDSEDEIGMREWKKQHLLFPLCETESVGSARSDRDQRLHHLKTRASLIGPWI